MVEEQIFLHTVKEVRDKEVILLVHGMDVTKI
jgi:hypothetical protein